MYELWGAFACLEATGTVISLRDSAPTSATRAAGRLCRWFDENVDVVTPDQALEWCHPFLFSSTSFTFNDLPSPRPLGELEDALHYTPPHFLRGVIAASGKQKLEENARSK